LTAGQGTDPTGRDPGQEKETFVRGVFETIADVYDPMNRVLTLGLWGSWQRRFDGLVRARPGERWLDVACGTGDLTLRLARRAAPGGEVVGVDLSPAMLAVARRKVQALPPGATVRLLEANALALPFADATFDGAVIGFALRNVRDIAGTLSEMTRVVRPGGQVVSLEVSHPDLGPVRAAFGLYFYHVAPLLGRLAGKGPEPYAWLAESLRRFPDRRRLEAMFRDAGLTDVRSWPLSLGAAAVHVGVVPVA
jgi:demethylmenaquinone methyltransferase/2-methoxy-6-polyprenyl-1,4-benzoquinol methylase